MRESHSAVARDSLMMKRFLFLRDLSMFECEWGKTSRGGETELEKLTAQISYIAEGQGTFTIKLQQKKTLTI